jgi:hypothetical protein
MPETHVILDSEYKDLDLQSCCLFTGAPLTKNRGEHVIPDWMQKEYALRGQHIQTGGPDALASIMQFRAPADEHANNFFGQVEDRIKRRRATKDELHLWSKKISVGMVWNHHRLSQNLQHPRAPNQFDDRRLRIALMDFHKEFSEFRAGGYVRSGSTLVLPTKVDSFWMTHAFGATVNSKHSETHDAISPFALVAVHHGSQLYVSALYDPERTLEHGRLPREWIAAGLHESTDNACIRAALAIIFSEEIVSPLMIGAGQVPNDDVYRYIAFQMGIVIERSPAGGGHYRRRNSFDPPPPPLTNNGERY